MAKVSLSGTFSEVLKWDNRLQNAILGENSNRSVTVSMLHDSAPTVILQLTQRGRQDAPTKASSKDKQGIP